MKLFTLLGAGALAVGTIVAAAPADAQRYGYGYDGGYDQGRSGHREYDRGGYGHGSHGSGGGHSYDGGYGYRGGHGYREHGYGGGYGFRGRGYGYHGRRVVCRIRHGYYGPVRRCFPIYR